MIKAYLRLMLHRTRPLQQLSVSQMSCGLWMIILSKGGTAWVTFLCILTWLFPVRLQACTSIGKWRQLSLNCALNVNPPLSVFSLCFSLPFTDPTCCPLPTQELRSTQVSLFHVTIPSPHRILTPHCGVPASSCFKTRFLSACSACVFPPIRRLFSISSLILFYI